MFESHQDIFIRIHEKSRLDHKNDSLGLVLLEGQHVDRQGNPTQDMGAQHEIFEDVKAISYVFGTDASDELIKFVQLLAQSYKVKYPKSEVKVGNVSWDSFKVDAKPDQTQRQEEPYRVRKFINNHKIMNEDWVKKKREEIEN